MTTKNTQLAAATANAKANAVARLCDNGYIKIYDGTQAATGDTAVGAQNLLATLRFASTSAPGASGGVVTCSTIAAVSAVYTSTATWFRCLASDNSTKVFDGSIGTSGGNMNFDSVAIQSGAQVSISAFTYTAPESTSGS